MLVVMLMDCFVQSICTAIYYWMTLFLSMLTIYAVASDNTLIIFVLVRIHLHCSFDYLIGEEQVIHATVL